jgi:tetratricopeptide (TPR) repeat protein
MEILSIGEKIKRARIYKDCTLKELCGDKISISKMSCIENDKVKPEEWIIDFIAKKLDLDKGYLMEGVREQILNNINWINGNVGDNAYEKEIQYNLEYALQHGFYDLAFELMHMLFTYYVNIGSIENIQVITSKYYEICCKSEFYENQITYYKDMARYFYLNNEYSQAAAYYNNLINILKNQGIFDKELLTSLMYSEATCHLALKNYNEAYNISNDLVEHIDCIKSDIEKAEMYNMLAMLALRMKTGKFEEYERLAFKYYDKEHGKKAYAMYYFATAMFDVGMNEKAINYINEGLKVHPKDDSEACVNYMLLCISELVNRNRLEQAQEICDEALNNAIGLDNVKLIERAYYFKSLILQKQGNILSAEMYMNLSLDALFKFGSRYQKYERYMEMGSMYHSLGQINDSLRYFSLALSIEKKM